MSGNLENDFIRSSHRLERRFDRDCRTVHLWVRWFVREANEDLRVGVAITACRRWAQRSGMVQPTPRAIRCVLLFYFLETRKKDGILWVEGCGLVHGGGARP
jgi:hypothetical protein